MSRAAPATEVSSTRASRHIFLHVRMATPATHTVVVQTLPPKKVTTFMTWVNRGYARSFKATATMRSN